MGFIKPMTGMMPMAVMICKMTRCMTTAARWAGPQPTRKTAKGQT